MRHFRDAIKTIPIGLCVLLYSSALMEGAAREEGAERNERYAAVWSDVKDEIDFQELDRLVDKLANFGPENREGASEELMERTELPLEPILIESQAKRIIARHAMWRRYLNELEQSVKQRVPLLLQSSSGPYSDHTLNRKRAAGRIGYRSPHPAFLPLLREVVANEEEPTTVRYSAITAISQIPDEGALQYLIEQIPELDDPALYGRLLGQLNKLTHANIWGQDKRRVQRDYEAWWREHRDEFEYDMETYMVMRSEY